MEHFRMQKVGSSRHLRRSTLLPERSTKLLKLNLATFVYFRTALKHSVVLHTTSNFFTLLLLHFLVKTRNSALTFTSAQLMLHSPWRMHLPAAATACDAGVEPIFAAGNTGFGQKGLRRRRTWLWGDLAVPHSQSCKPGRERKDGQTGHTARYSMYWIKVVRNRWGIFFGVFWRYSGF